MFARVLRSSTAPALSRPHIARVSLRGRWVSTLQDNPHIVSRSIPNPSIIDIDSAIVRLSRRALSQQSPPHPPAHLLAQCRPCHRLHVPATPDPRLPPRKSQIPVRSAFRVGQTCPRRPVRHLAGPSDGLDLGLQSRLWRSVLPAEGAEAEGIWVRRRGRRRWRWSRGSECSRGSGRRRTWWVHPRVGFAQSAGLWPDRVAGGYLRELGSGCRREFCGWDGELPELGKL